MNLNFSKAFTVLALTAATGLLANCASSEKRADHRAAPSAADQATSNLDADRTQFVTTTQARIDEMTKFSQQLRSKADAAQTPRPQGKKLANAAEDLDSLLNDARKSLTDVRSAAPANWVDYKRDVTKTLDRAETAYANDVRLLQ
jgi:hypothetical protein